MIPGNSRSGARPPLAPCSSISLAGRPCFGHSGRRAVARQPAAAIAARASGKEAAGRIRVSVPPCRSGAASAPAQTASRPGCPRLADSREGSGERVPPAGWYGGLAQAWWNTPRSSGRAGRSAVTNARPAIPFASTLRAARATSAGSRSTPSPRTPGTRAARHNSAAPAPDPPSSTRSFGRAGIAAASNTGSMPLRNPSRGCA